MIVFYSKDEYPSIISNSIVQASTAIQIAVASQSFAISLKLSTTLFYSSPKTTHGSNSTLNLSSSSQNQQPISLLPLKSNINSPGTVDHHTYHLPQPPGRNCCCQRACVGGNQAAPAISWIARLLLNQKITYFIFDHQPAWIIKKIA